MSVFRSGRVWRAQVYVRGRVVADETGFKREKEAKAWHDAKKLSIENNGEVRQVRFEEFLEHFKQWHLARLRPGTRRRYMVDIEQRIEPAFRYMRLSDITAGLIEQMKAKWAQELSPKSVNNCLHMLRLMLNRAVRWKMLLESKYETESLEVPHKPYPWWDKEEHIQRFLEAAKESRYYLVYLIALETGMRYGEILGLCAEDIDLTEGTIHVYRQWLDKEKSYGPTKHGKDRWIDFNPNGELAAALRSHISGRQEVHNDARADAFVPGHGMLFSTSTGRRPAKQGVAHKYFKAAIRRAGVPVICFHGLRHTFASWYMIQHDNVWDLAAILGHSNIKTTMRYAHHSTRARRKPLDLAFIAQNSHTIDRRASGTNGNYLEKKWRDGRDSNPKAPNLRVVT